MEGEQNGDGKVAAKIGLNGPIPFVQGAALDLTVEGTTNVRRWQVRRLGRPPGGYAPASKNHQRVYAQVGWVG